jgi:hypothetical protein
MVKCMTGIYPVQAYLKRIGKAQSPICPHCCSGAIESLLSNGAGGNQTESRCRSIINELPLWIYVAHLTCTQPSYSLQQCGNSRRTYLYWKRLAITRNRDGQFMYSHGWLAFEA